MGVILSTNFSLLELCHRCYDDYDISVPNCKICMLPLYGEEDAGGLPI